MRAGTIVASNYVEMAKVLGESFMRHHGGKGRDGSFVILVVDDDPIGEVPDGLEIQRLADLDLSPATVDLMRTIYDVMEFSTAVKPSFLRGLLRDDEIACYLDPDIFVYSNFDDLLDPVRQHGIVLTPHVFDPIPRDDCDPSEGTIMRSGIFNLGFVGVGRSAGRFLDWWQDRLVYDAVVDIDNGLFTDQRWIDWVPGLFDFQRCDDRGMNIAWWNIHERDVRVAGGDTGSPTCDGEPVRFIHFSGYDPFRPDDLSKHQHPKPRTAHAEGLGIRVLAEEYGALLIERGHTERRHDPYPWSTGDAATGYLELNGLLRTLIRSSIVAEHVKGVDPERMKTPFAFGESSGGLRPWLEAPDGGSTDFPISRAERALWDSRLDLRIVFPELAGDDGPRYRGWLRDNQSARDVLGELEPALPVSVGVPVEPASVGGAGARAASVLRRGVGRAKRELKSRVSR